MFYCLSKNFKSQNLSFYLHWVTTCMCFRLSFFYHEAVWNTKSLTDNFIEVGKGDTYNLWAVYLTVVYNLVISRRFGPETFIRKSIKIQKDFRIIPRFHTYSKIIYYRRALKAFFPLILTFTTSHLYQKKLVLLLFSLLLACSNPTILLDAMLQALVLCWYFFQVLWVIFIHYIMHDLNIAANEIYCHL